MHREQRKAPQEPSFAGLPARAHRSDQLGLTKPPCRSSAGWPSPPRWELSRCCVHHRQSRRASQAYEGGAWSLRDAPFACQGAHTKLSRRGRSTRERHDTDGSATPDRQVASSEREGFELLRDELSEAALASHVHRVTTPTRDDGAPCERAKTSALPTTNSSHTPLAYRADLAVQCPYGEGLDP